MDRVQQMKRYVKFATKRMTPFSDDLFSIERELRQRRKSFLCSYVSVRSLLSAGGQMDDEGIQSLSSYLAERAVHLWQIDSDIKEKFARHFFQITLYALASGEVGQESMDDIIQFSECLVRSRDTFVYVMKRILPEELHGSLFFVADTFDKYNFDVRFQDSVLGAVSIFLGALTDPIDFAMSESQHEEIV